MKKKFIVAIVLSTVGLLFGGLIYVGVSSFPELLKSEKAIKAEEERATFNNHVVNIEEVVEEPEVIFDSVSSVSSLATDNESHYVEASTSVKSASTIDAHDKELILIEFQPIEWCETSLLDSDIRHTFISEPIETIVEEPVVTNEHVSYSSIEKADEGVQLETLKVKKNKVNKNQSVRSNQAVVETSLLVIGAVDILSVILIRRRKHLFR